MAITSLIIGDSGTGKSTSLRNLDPSETFLINVIDKLLPIRGGAKLYAPLSPDGMTGNYYVTDDYSAISRVIKLINDKRPDIKNLVIDDFQYIMGNEFMRRATEKSWDKFTEIGQHADHIIMQLLHSRADLFAFVLSHNVVKDDGTSTLLTLGKILDDKIKLIGKFSAICHTKIVDEKYYFLTHNDGYHVARMPFAMEIEKLIPNDLALLKEKLDKFVNEDI